MDWKRSLKVLVTSMVIAGILGGLIGWTFGSGPLVTMACVLAGLVSYIAVETMLFGSPK